MALLAPKAIESGRLGAIPIHHQLSGDRLWVLKAKRLWLEFNFILIS